MGHIHEYYTGKTLLVTGATGLVGKVLVEKVLHDLPDVERIYVLIRPKKQQHGSTLSAADRFSQEILSTSAFDGLRAKYSEQFKAYVSQKVVAVAGDLSQERLGLSEPMYRQLQQEVNVVINSAALVSFDAPLDQALTLNVVGTKRILEFTRGCTNAIYAHISTCYVNGTREGPVPEEPFHPTFTVGHFNKRPQTPYDVDDELIAIQRQVERLKKDNAGKSPEQLEKRLVKEGFQWAQRRGWNDVYTFTKAMGEQLIVRYQGEVPTLVLRPSIIESSMQTPQPGWLDGFRMLDPLIVAYGRERLPDFPGNKEGILDIVPVDMVVNALLAAIPWSHHRGGLQICHVASGMENPLMLPRFARLVQEHFRKVPLNARSNRPQNLPDMTFPSTPAFLRKLYLHQRLPLRLSIFMAKLNPNTDKRRRALRVAESKQSALDRLGLYARLYGPYAEVRCQYLTHHMREVWDSLSPAEREQFNFDVRTIDWARYIQDIHIGGIRRFLLNLSTSLPTEPPVRTVVQEIEASSDTILQGANSSSPGASMNGPSYAGADKAAGQPRGGQASAVAVRRATSLIMPAPQAEVKRWLRSSPLAKVSQAAWRMWLDIFYHAYLGFSVDGLEHVPSKGPLVVVSNHSSHLDSGALIVALKRRNHDLHPMAARDYFFNTPFRRWASRVLLNAAPFDRERHVGESLALALGILNHGHSVIFFPEGSRSTSGVVQPFKRGIGLLAVESGVPVLPAYISGTYQSLPKGKGWPARHHVHVRFGPPIIATTASNSDESPTDLVRRLTADVQRAVEALAAHVPSRPHR
ncbi:MAG: NAD-dependent epimerase/dehydratase family protein [Dehalococcoidia bacterium]|nr:NAD-dependent epimerase/dehydratase family protein [Dehalococcoidia bacterium]